MRSLLEKLVTYRSRRVEVVVETGLDVSAKGGFDLCLDYARFITVILGEQSRAPDPEWIEGGPGQVGGVVRYFFQEGGGGTTITERVDSLEEDPEAGVYTLEYRMLEPEPFPLRNHSCTWTLTQEPDHPDRCRLRWVRRFDTPMILGLVSLAGFLRTRFLRSAHTIIDHAVRPWCRKQHPSGERRLPRPSDRVLVVGAGPSGLHMSHLLRNRLGIEDISIVEISDRIGGKTVTIDDEHHPGVVHELGTCYLHPAYFAVRALVEELKAMPGCDDPDFGREVAPEGYAIQGAGREAYTLEEWVTSELEGQPRWSPWALSRILVPKMDTAAELLTAKARYKRLHQEHLGDYDYSMPPKLTQEAMQALDMSFGQFLESNGLSALLPILAYGQTCQGYGAIESTPAFWAMCWITPELLDGYFAVQPRYPKKAMFRQGWRSIWDMLVKVNDFRIEKRTKVEHVHRRDDGTMEVRTVDLDGGGTRTRDFDYLVVAAPMLDPIPRKPGEEKLAFEQLTPDQARLLQSDRITNGHFRTVLYTLFEPQPYLDTHLEIDAERVLGPEVGQGRVFASRDSYLAVNPEYCDLQGHQVDPARGDVREQMAYQYVETGRAMSEDELEDRFVEWADDQFGANTRDGSPKYQIRDRRSWTYFQRFDREGLLDRMPWQLLEIQGRERTMVVHASTFFESVLDIVNYNNMIVSGLAGELNRLGPPRDDARPDPLASEHWRIFYQWSLRLPLTVLTIVLGVIWTALYAVVRPLLAFTVIRWQRKRLQTAFRTENPGPWWKFDMSHFLAVSPSVRCVREDDEDAVMALARDRLEEQYPEIPRVDWALRLNYRDYRTVVREWQKLVRPTYFRWLHPMTWWPQGYAAPLLSRFPRWLSSTFPVLYNYVFSWSAAITFNCLTGFGLRIEDDRGGGLYVPRCHMLRVAREEYGEELGCRMCTRVCKIFTEEYMSSLGMPCVLEPDLEKGSCMVRAVGERSAAFSDHQVAWWLESRDPKA